MPSRADVESSTKLEDYVSSDLAKLKARLRSKGIHSLQEMDYSNYLRSRLWEKIRLWVLDRDKHTCQVCLSRKKSSLSKFDVHHRNYDLPALEGRNCNALVTLCRQCHKKIEYHEDGERRSNLRLKEEEYQRLLLLHARIVSEGLPVSINAKESKNAFSYQVKFDGPEEFTEFYSLGSLMYGFVLGFYFEHKEKYKIPLPFGSDKMYQKSGAKIRDALTGKTRVRVTCSVEQTAIIRISKDCVEPVSDHFVQYLKKTKYWKLASQ